MRFHLLKIEWGKHYKKMIYVLTIDILQEHAGVNQGFIQILFIN